MPGQLDQRVELDRLGLAGGEEYGFELFHAERRRDQIESMLRLTYIPSRSCAARLAIWFRSSGMVSPRRGLSSPYCSEQEG